MLERSAWLTNIAKLVAELVGSESVDSRGELEVIVSRLADFDLLCFLLLGDSDMVNHRNVPLMTRDVGWFC